MTALKPGDEFWDANATEFELRAAEYFGEGIPFDQYPGSLSSVFTHPTMLSAFGGLISHLRMLQLDRELVPIGEFMHYDPLRESSCLILDGKTLINLEVLQNNVDGKLTGSLFGLLDNCCTSFGNR